MKKDDLKSILLSGDRITLEKEGATVVLNLTMAGTGALFRDQRPLCVEGDEKEGKLFTVVMSDPDKEDEKDIAQNVALESDFRIVCPYSAENFPEPGEGVFSEYDCRELMGNLRQAVRNAGIRTECIFQKNRREYNRLSSDKKNKLKNLENAMLPDDFCKGVVQRLLSGGKPEKLKRIVPKISAAFQVDGKGVLLCETSVDAKFTVTKPAKNAGGKPDPNREYAGGWHFKPMSEKLAKDRGNLHKKDQKEFMIEGDIPVFEKNFEGGGSKITVIAKKKDAGIKGSGEVERNGRKICLEKDGKKFSADAEYAMKGHCVGGKGMVSFVSFPDGHKSPAFHVGGKALLSPGTRFNAKFQAAKPVRETPDSPDHPIKEFGGIGEFVIIRNVKDK